ncbi:MAG: heme-binding protein, partial [Betaproteobacteria bacterium]
MTRLTLESALRAIDGALVRGTELGCAPLTVVVLDAGGHDIALQR